LGKVRKNWEKWEKFEKFGKIWKNLGKYGKIGKNRKKWEKWEKNRKNGKNIFPLVHFQKESATPRREFQYSQLCWTNRNAFSVN
jgi:hypothetical protein